MISVRKLAETKRFLALEFFPLRVQKVHVLPMFLAPNIAILHFSIQNRKSTMNVMVFDDFTILELPGNFSNLAGRAESRGVYNGLGCT